MKQGFLTTLLMALFCSRIAESAPQKPAAIWHDSDGHVAYYAYIPIVKIRHVPSHYYSPEHITPDQLAIEIGKNYLTDDQFKELFAKFPEGTYLRPAEVGALGDVTLDILLLGVHQNIVFHKGIGLAWFDPIYIDIPNSQLDSFKSSFANPDDPIVQLSGYMKADFPFKSRFEQFAREGVYCHRLTDDSHTVKDAIRAYARLSEVVAEPSIYDTTRESMVRNFYAQCFEPTLPPGHFKSFAELLDAPITALKPPEYIIGETNHPRPDTIFEFKYVVQKE